MRELVFFVLGALLVLQLKGVIGAKPRFAPKYCLRFKFDCTSPEKKGHVCCLFPLPVDGNGLENKSALAESGLAPSDGIGVKKIRPLRLPSRRYGEETEEHSSHGQNRYNVFNQKKNVKSGTKTATNTPKRKETSKKKNSVEKVKPTKSSAGIKRPSIRAKRPLLCRRLVINCRKNPAHTCCKFEEQRKKEEEEETEKRTDDKEEESITTVDIIPETTQNINHIEVSTIPPEDKIQRLKILPELRSEKKVTKVAPKIRNNEVRLRVVGNKLSKPIRNIEYKDNSSNVRTIKKGEGVVATIEAVPLEIANRNNPTHIENKSEENNDMNVQNHQGSQGLQRATTVQSLDNGTDSHIPLVPLVELPLVEEEPYERIPAECFTMSFDCKKSPSHMCCAYHQ